MFIAMIASECAPVAKVGGLADVVYGLSRELGIRGHTVEIVLPKYDCMRHDQVSDLRLAYNDLWVPWADGEVHCTVWFGVVHGCRCFFIEPHDNDGFFNRGAFYGFPDDYQRFAFFSKSAIEFLYKTGKRPDIVHTHDWQTALAPVLLYEIYEQLGMDRQRACHTIHNFAHQGVVGGDVLWLTGLGRPQHFFAADRLADDSNPLALNLTKGAIVYSNFVTTVSPHHAWEVGSSAQGRGLGQVLHLHHRKFGGVLNGLDYEMWNPERDPFIPVTYGVETIEQRKGNTEALRRRFQMRDAAKPIVAFVGRLDAQKGVHLIQHAISYTLTRGGQFVLLGASVERRINDEFMHLRYRLRDDPDCHLELGFDDELAHLIYAGADVMIVPSMFEPCGLTQMIAMRYGAVPVVRAVGGLADTVFDRDHSERLPAERNGYVFEHADNPGIESALERALALWFDEPEHFRQLRLAGMHADWSWKQPAQHYLNIYDYIRYPAGKP
jgi:starch synthase